MKNAPIPEATLNALISQVLTRILQDTQETIPVTRKLDLKNDMLLNTADTSVLLGIPEATLVKWRSTGEVSLPIIKIGRAIRYNTVDLRLWLDANTQNKPGVKV